MEAENFSGVFAPGRQTLPGVFIAGGFGDLQLDGEGKRATDLGVEVPH